VNDMTTRETYDSNTLRAELVTSRAKILIEIVGYFLRGPPHDA
jgi:hypothetical protein